MRWLLAKDLRLLRRSPLLLGTLVIYPLTIALLIGFAVSSPPGKPAVAVYSGVRAGQGKIAFGSQRISLAGYADQLFSSIDRIPASSPRQAVADVRDGRALAALIIPAGIDHQIQQLITNGLGNPTVQVVLSSRNPLERQLAHDAIQTRVDAVQYAVSRELLKTVAADLRKLLDGGTVSFLGRSIHLLGLRGSEAIVRRTIASLPRVSSQRPALKQVISFAQVAIAGLAIAGPGIGGVTAPLTVRQSAIDASTTPTVNYAVAIAAVVLLMFVALLVAAGMLALERAEHAYERLVRGLVSREALLAEKVVLAAACALVMTLAVVAAIAIFVSLDWGRFELWVLALALGAAAFAALGVAVGAIARDVSVASLLAFLISLPVAFIALVPAQAVSSGVRTALAVISFLFPFRPALTATAAAFSPGPLGVGGALLHLVALTAAYLLLARVALTRFAER
ncbi:MAG: ABC transporter permease [Actinomycetota bacterium]|nr:ABC transporter permease [Actinomycetota bacterium]